MRLFFRYKLLLLIFALAIICNKNIFSQKVAVVLSGGGARGTAHIGVLKALEEEKIPIDYIAGTSIGAIIGGLYACGYTIKEMEELVASKEFKNWANGNIDEKYIYYFKQSEPDASWASFEFNYDSVLETHLPTNLISPHQMDFAFKEIFSPASVASNNNFDSLFIPFRCVASDISESKPYILRKGDVGNAIRASMTFPFYFRPIRIDGKLMLDGGMYNNFPSDVVYNDFFPDIIIGSKVADNYDPPGTNDLISQIGNVLMAKTNYTVICANSILIEPNVKDIGLTNFSRATINIDSGYAATKRRINEIRLFVTDTVDSNILSKKRQEFNNRKPPLIIDECIISGLKKNQVKYVNKQLLHRKKQVHLSDMKSDYFKLLADDKINNITPEVKYNKSTGFYDLILDIEKNKNLSALFGGNVSSNTHNMAFIELQYKYFSKRSITVAANTYIGRFYTSAKLAGNFDFPSKLPYSLHTTLTYNQWDYFETSTYFFNDETPSYLIQNENHWKVFMKVPARNHGKFEGGYAAARVKDKYYQTNLFSRNDTTDITYFDFQTTYLEWERNTLNRKQYANKGEYSLVEVRQVIGKERHEPGSTSNRADIYELHHDFFQLKCKYDNYFKKYKNINFAIHSELLASNRKLFDNYTSTALNAPAFQPIPESNTLFLPKFRAFNFAAIGFETIYIFSNTLDLRLGGYVFQPYKEIIKKDDLSAKLGKAFNKRYFIATSSLVYHSPIGPVALSLSYFDNPNKEFSFSFNLGYIIFNKKAID
ncbi:MAG: patatin-like phospholipase family protein [Saprospiraceae bacterium]|nr:patatin-like phospholipase family protein [Saprospiraceae bacterium]